jgi:hypothetical protein
LAAKGGWAAAGAINERRERGQQLRAEQDAAQKRAAHQELIKSGAADELAREAGTSEGGIMYMPGSQDQEKAAQRAAQQAERQKAINQIEAGEFTKDPRLGKGSTAEFAKKQDGSGYTRYNEGGSWQHISNEDWNRGERGENPETGAKESINPKKPKKPKQPRSK